MKLYHVDDKEAKSCINCKYLEATSKNCKQHTDIVGGTVAARSARDDEEACGKDGKYFESKYQSTALVDVGIREND